MRAHGVRRASNVHSQVSKLTSGKRRGPTWFLFSPRRARGARIMESGHSTMLEDNTSGEDSMLIETVKSIAAETRDARLGSDEDFFLVSQVHAERYENLEVAPPSKQHIADVLADLCRICANANDHLIPIFEDEGMEHQLPDKILKYLPIHVSQNDTLPLQLCYHCATTLLAWHELSEGCLNAERRLLEMQDASLQNKQYYNAESLIDFVPASITTTTTTTTTTTSATTVTVTHESADSQPDQHADDKDTETQGMEESDKSNRLKNPITHNRITNHRANRNVLEERRSKVNLLQTESTNATNPTNTLSLASDIATEKPAGRPLCANDASSKTQSKSTTDDEEITTKNPDTSTLATEIANAALKARANRPKRKTRNTWEEQLSVEKTHDSHASEIGEKTSEQTEKPKNDISTSRAITCRFCDKTFRSRKSHWAHARTHTAEKSYTCHVCGKQFTQGGSLYYHLKHVHDGVKNHACDICGRSFAMKTAMEDHRRIHTGERPYVCDACGKTFKTKASLYIHGRTHTNEFPHECTYCAKRFRWRQQMLSHLTVHTGEKNHTCDICGKGFGVRNDLTRHRRVHSDEKPYTCQRCGISFGQKRYLKSHERLRLGTCGYSRKQPELVS